MGKVSAFYPYIETSIPFLFQPVAFCQGVNSKRNHLVCANWHRHLQASIQLYVQVLSPMPDGQRRIKAGPVTGIGDKTRWTKPPR